MKINKNIKKSITPYITFIVLAMLVLVALDFAGQKVNVLTYDEFEEVLTTKKVVEINITPRDRAKVYEIRGTLKGYKEKETFFVRVPFSEQVMSRILMAREESNFKLETNADPESSTFLLFLLNVLPIIALIGFAFFFFTRQMNGANKSLDFGKSRAKLNEDSNKVTFKDVAGLQEEKEEVAELIDFLKNPKKFQSLGARIPKGVLLFGPPGTGKTLLARAVAGESGVPFFSISGSDFVEMFVGVGASRVRDLFEQAKKSAPCIVFIDEIDAVGRQRGAGLGGGHDEREQTLNQLLVEMDGFGVNEGIIIIAATNRPDILDPALLRPGRFDRQIVVDKPDVKGRLEILKVHTKGKPVSNEVSLEVLARRTPGFTGADLSNLVNEAALLTARRNKKRIDMPEMEESVERVVAGPERKSKVISDREKKLTAYHEAGHALVGMLLDNTDPVHKVSIIPRGRAGGYTLMLPKEDRYYATRTELSEQLCVLLGGRVAEAVVLKEISTGAQNDLERVTGLARKMITEYGMSEKLGPITFGHRQEQQVFLGRDISRDRNYGEEVASAIDKEVRRLIDGAYVQTETMLNENIDKLHLIANSLIERETLEGGELEELLAHGHISEKKTTEGIVLTKNEDSNAESQTGPKVVYCSRT